VPPDKPDERLLIEALCWQNGEIIDVSNATIITAARYARRTAMLPNYIAKGDPF
jgi:hypothetical protein